MKIGQILILFSNQLDSFILKKLQSANSLLVSLRKLLNEMPLHLRVSWNTLKMIG